MKFKSIATALLGAVAACSTMAFKAEEAHASPFQFQCVRGANGGFVTIVTNGRESQSLITWNSQAFSRSGYTPEVRCQAVTNRFNDAVNNGIRLRLTAGQVNGLGVICSLQGRERGCNEDNVIVTLAGEAARNPRQALNELVNAAAGGRPLAQSGSVTLNDWAGAALE